MQSHVLAAGAGHLDDKVGTGYEVAQLAELLGEDRTVVEVFGFAEDEVEAVESALQPQVAPHNADIVPHKLLQLAFGLGDKHHFLVEDHALGVPVGYLSVQGVAGFLRLLIVLSILLNPFDGTHGGVMGIDHSLEQGVAGQAVATMQTGAGALAGSIEVPDGGLAVAVHLDAAALVVSSRPDGNHVLGDINAQLQAFGIDGGESVDELLLADAAGVEVEVFDARLLHLVVDGACHDVARRQREPGVVFVHELVALKVLQDGTGTPHGLGDEEGRFFGRVVERRGVELHELQVSQHAAGAVNHGHTVAGGDDGSGGGGIDVAHAACGQEGDLGEVGIDLIGAAVEGVNAIAFDAGCVFGDPLPKMVLGDEVDGELVFFQLDIGVVVDCLQESAFDFGTGIILVVQDAELGVSALTVEVEAVAGTAFVEVYAILDKFADAVGCFADGHFHHLAVADAVARDEGVLDVFVETVAIVHNGGDATLCIAGGAFCGLALAEDTHLAIGGHLQGVAQACNARPDD